MSDIVEVNTSAMTIIAETPKEILEGKPSGATHYAIIGEVGNVGDVTDMRQVIYLFESPYGFRQIKGNLIGFASTGIRTSEIKRL